MIKRFVLPGLAEVVIGSDHNGKPLLTITLDPEYRGDLNDLAEQNTLPNGVYLQCDSVTAIDNPALAKFMEVLHHWDYNADGQFDGDQTAEAIETALHKSTEAPDHFARPSGGIYTRFLMALMPPQPERPIVFGFGELRERFRRRHYLLAIPTIVAVIGLIQLQVWLLPWMQYSVLSGLIAIAGALAINGWLALGILVVLLIPLSKLRRRQPSTPSHSMHTYGFFNRAAVYEEQAFREGAENWNWGQRLISCLVFGAIHMVNLIYPLATILPLTLGGAVFMYVYLHDYRQTNSRRSAVLAAALVHRVYNRIALMALGIWLVAIVGNLVLGLASAILALTLMMMYRGGSWRFARQPLQPAPQAA